MSSLPQSDEQFEDGGLDRLKSRSIRGGMVTGVSQGLVILTQLASVTILSRLLQPEDFGTVAMVFAVTAFAQIFRDLGLSAATIQKENITADQLASLFWINVASGSALTVILAASSPLVAAFYGQAELTWVTLAISPIFVIGSVGSQSGAVLTRDMRFGRLAIGNICGPLLNLIIAVALASNGFGYWALVVGALAGMAANSAANIFFAKPRVHLPRHATGLREFVRFGGNVTAFNVINYFGRNLDNILIGRVSGATALGLYDRAYRMLMFPILNLRAPVQSVAFPAMSRLQRQPHEYRRYYRGVILILAFVSMPLTAFLFVTAPQVVELLLGAGWSEAAQIYRVLAIVAFIQPCTSTIGLVLLSSGHGQRYLTSGLLGALLTAFGFVVGVRWGPVGVATAYVFTTYVGFVPIAMYSFSGTPLRLGDLVFPLARPAAASLVAAAALYAVFDWFSSFGVALAVVSSAASFGVAYLIVYAAAPGGRADLTRLVRLVRAAKRGM